MSDLDDELLGLAEGTSSGRRKTAPAKRKRAPVPQAEDSASDMDMSSASDTEPSSSIKAARNVRPRHHRRSDDGEAGDGADGPQIDDRDPRDKYRLEGKYIDHHDRARQSSDLLSHHRIEAMNELDREAILGERQDEINIYTERLQLRQMVQRKEKKDLQGGVDESDEDDEYDMRPTRDRKMTGTTREKRDGLAKLRKSREGKAQKREQKVRRPHKVFFSARLPGIIWLTELNRTGQHRARDHDYDDEDNDGEQHRTLIRKPTASSDAYTDSESETERRSSELTAAKAGLGRTTRKEDVATESELGSVLVPRSKLAAFCNAPWFGEWIKDAWVRLGVGLGPDRLPQYRLCRVSSVREGTQSYRLEQTTTNTELELCHGNSVRFFQMHVISDSPMVSREFSRLQRQLLTDQIPFPSQKDVNRIRKKLDEHNDYVMTEADVAAVLAKKGARVNAAAGKARLLIQRDFARQAGDDKLLAEVSAQLATFDAPAPSPGPVGSEHESEQDRMKRLNERNRATNREDIKKAEGRAQEERRRQAAALARGDSSVKVDPSARVKTMTRLTYDRDTLGRATGFADQSNPHTPTETSAKPSSQSAASGQKFEKLVASRINVDVDLDF
ncbi:BZ3500_MvSof-1268-A1-R1_Chr6-3g08856 [Microbotryum saponariae]|uniref:BZ3500_MvSof-1268-A1-R1_Chr6-3g08856 protein n=1 Tax=Microbotryum saponariae TaxID=289078 RepID=A0A2X0NNW0_9BASI|nr:BZ3500_MvSof-1268-A1-R1_Chr6-3g08856 [Microbotryum saponariae]SDA07457.1 BZ3501_MvSof-1269-A2-R1_Chr6-2g08559 [Microbotryum saponariae]